MDGTLTLIFANSLTTQDAMTKISASLQLNKKRILTKFGGCGTKNRPPTPTGGGGVSQMSTQVNKP